TGAATAGGGTAATASGGKVAVAGAGAGAGGAAATVTVASRGAADGGAAGGGTPSEILHRKLDEGMALHKEKRYAEAAAAFEAAVQLAPTNVLAANNLGFTYFKLERFAD